MADKNQGLRITHALGHGSPYVDYGDDQRLLGSLPSAFSPTTQFDDTGKAGSKSPNVYFSQSSSRNEAKQHHRAKWYSIAAIYATGIYSTLMSGAWLTIAIKQPHWGRFINLSGGTLTPSVASTIITALAKSIEVSFVTFFLSMTGQFLTRQAHGHNAPGISLADVQLKMLLVLPGTIFTQWKSYGRVLLSLLGLASLVACLSSMLYITASEALVTPKPSTTSSMKILQGQVNTTPANLDYIQKDCPTGNEGDKPSCAQIGYSGHAYNNFIQYLRSWQPPPLSGITIDPANRPPPIAVFKDNVTVQGSWVDSISTEGIGQKYNRSITNVTMAMPHTGVVAAASIEDNGLPQVNNTEGSMIAYIEARTVVPTVNVLCAQGSAEELVPLIYQNWTYHINTTTSGNMTVPTGWYNQTVLDPVFGFDAGSYSPVFYRLPGLNNSVLNRNYKDQSSIYALIASGSKQQTDYNLCRMSMGLRGGCSSELSVSITGFILKSNCTKHDMAYDNSLELAQNDTPANWVELADSWAEAVALNTWDTDTNASTPYMLTTLTAHSQSANPTRPLMVEGLAVLAANTILDSMEAAPFDGSWPYPSATVEEPVMQPFTARVTMSDFASGISATWQHGFLFVLGSVFFLNLVFLGYLLSISAVRPCLSRVRKMDTSRYGLWRDCTDLNELFQIALNSPQPGLGSPVGVAQEKGKLYDMKWHFRNSAAMGTPRSGGLDGLHLAFDGEENYRMGTPRESYFDSPVAEGASPRKR